MADGSSAIDLAIVSALALGDIFVAPLPAAVLGSVFFAAIVFASVLDMAKLALFVAFELCNGLTARIGTPPHLAMPDYA